jgi:hypothetical protein
VPTDYVVPGGLTLDYPRSTADMIVQYEVVGIALGDFEPGDDMAGTSSIPGRSSTPSNR